MTTKQFVLGFTLPVLLCLFIGLLVSLALPVLVWWQWAIVLYALWFVIGIAKQHRV